MFIADGAVAQMSNRWRKLCRYRSGSLAYDLHAENSPRRVWEVTAYGTRVYNMTKTDSNILSSAPHTLVCRIERSEENIPAASN